jgi:PAS domain S-box-containing protein
MEAEFNPLDDLEPLIEAVRDPVVILDSEWKITDASPGFCDRLGKPVEDLIEVTFPSLIHPDDMADAEDSLSRLRQVGHGDEFTGRLRMTEGWCWYQWSGIASHGKNGEIERIVLSARNISIQKELEEALRQSRTRYDSVLACSRDAIFIHDLDATLVEVNDRTCELLGYSREELIGMSAHQFHPPAATQRIDALFDDFPERRMVQFEVPVTRKTGRTFLAKTCIHLVDPGKGICIGVMRDVTSQRETERALNLERELAHRYLDVAGSILIEIDCDSHVKMINRKGCEVLGLDREHVIGRSWIENFVPEDARELVRDRLKRLIAGGLDNYGENKIICRDGELRTIAWTNRVVRDDAEHATGLLSSGEDITDHLKIQTELEDSLALQQSLFRAAPIGIGMVRNRVLAEVNDCVCEMTGHCRDELIGQGSRILYPAQEDYEFVSRERSRQIHERGTADMQTRFRCRDGKIINVLLSFAPLNPDDLTKGISFTALDITDRIRMEEDLRASEAKYRALSEQITDVVYSLDATGRITYIGPQIERYGYTPEEMIGRPATEFIFEGDRQRAEEDIAYSLSGEGDMGILTFRIASADGSEVFWFEEISKVPRNEAGDVTGIVGVMRGEYGIAKSCYLPSIEIVSIYERVIQ